MKSSLTLGAIPGRNLRSHPIRTVILLLLTLLQAFCIFATLEMARSAGREMERAEQRLGADILIYPSSAMSRISGQTLLMQGTPVEVWRDRSLLKRLSDCEGLKQVAFQTYIQDRTGAEKRWIAALDPEEDFVIAPWTEQGTLSGLRTGEAVAGCRVPEEEGNVKLFGRSWPVFRRLEETGSELDDMVFVSRDTLELLLSAAGEEGVKEYEDLDPRQDFSVALVRVQDRQNLESITNWMNVYIRKVKAVRSEETLSSAAAGIRGQTGILLLTALGASLVLLLALGIARSLMMKERKRELYVWHALGASRGVVRSVMLREALLVHGAGALAGVAAGAAAFCLVPGSPFSPWAALLTAALSLGIGCLSTLLSLRRATRSMNGQMLLTV